MNGHSLAACALSLLFLSAPARADRVLTEDGRILIPEKARKSETGYTITFANGTIEVGMDQGIREVEIEGDMSDYVPQNEDEREKLEKGYVKYRSQWMSKVRYKNELRKEHEAMKERLEELAAHSNFYNAWEEETKHFIIRTNTSPELLEYYGDLLEAYYSLMDKRIGIKPTPKYRRLKMTVNVYKNSEEFHDLSAGDPGPSVLGYFWSYDNTLNFYHDYQDPDRSKWVGLHECTHLLTFLIDQQYEPQIWLNEAVADYLGSAIVSEDKRGKLTIEPGQIQTDRVLTVQQAIKENKDTKLKSLFFIDRGAFHGFEYAHAWSFVYFLNNFDKGKYSKGFWKFFKALYTLEKGVKFDITSGGGGTGTGKKVAPADIRDLLLKKIKVKDLDALETEWKTFIKEIAIDTPVARFKRGYRAVLQGRFSEALDDLTAAIDSGLEDPRAWAARGKALAFTGSRGNAKADYARAIELDPLNAGFRYEYSLLLSGRPPVGGRVTITIQGVPIEAPTDPQAREQAGLAMELAPENDRFREWFGEFK
jgi:tetratricopeptide (TPR) repeat protein